MQTTPEVHDALACLLSYPEESKGTRYPDALRTIRTSCPETADALASFEQGIADLSPGELEELYTRTFDNVAERSLEVGWQLFGENYARGVLLVRLRALLRKYDVPEATELPDHMTHVLQLIGRAPAGLADALIEGQVGPAIEKMLEGLRSMKSPWVGVLEAARMALRTHAPVTGVKETT